MNRRDIIRRALFGLPAVAAATAVVKADAIKGLVAADAAVERDPKDEELRAERDHASRLEGEVSTLALRVEELQRELKPWYTLVGSCLGVSPGNTCWTTEEVELTSNSGPYHEWTQDPKAARYKCVNCGETVDADFVLGCRDLLESCGVFVRHEFVAPKS